MRRHGAKLVASALITVGLVFALKKGGLKFIPDGGNFDHVRWWTLPAYLVTLVALSYFRAVRWRYLLRSFAEVPTRKLLSVSWIGFAAILVMPFRIGEFVRPYMIRSPGKTDAQGRTVGGVTMSAATGTIVAERVVDLLYLSIVLAVALLVVPHAEPLPKSVAGMPAVSLVEVRRAAFLILGLSMVAFAVVAVYYVARDFARRATLAVFGLVSRPLGEKLAGMAESMADGLRVLGRARDAIPFLGETTLYWGLNAAGMWLLAWGCGITHADGSAPTYGEACAMMGMLGITIIIPGPPGMLGVFQLGLSAGMSMYFTADTTLGEGAAYIFLLYLVQVLWTVAAAIGCLLMDRGSWRALEEAEGILPPSEPPDPPANKLATPDAAR
ncbi:MAG: lysylphosphatidylglycerol synthase transmembrane domain-containing protein [Polyangiaceae bacterium]|jgi:glycosyltransferase 2 family protein